MCPENHEICLSINYRFGRQVDKSSDFKEGGYLKSQKKVRKK